MADVLGSIFGSGQDVKTTQQLDPNTKALNQLKLVQLSDLFGGSSGGIGQFTTPKPEAYTAHPGVSAIGNYAMNNLNSLTATPMGAGITGDAYKEGSLTDIADTYNFQRGVGMSDLGSSLAGLEGNYLESIAANQYNFQDALARSRNIYDTAMQSGLDASRNYISQIATPQIQSAMALQGLEQGGAVPAAIARATAESIMPYMQGLNQQFMAEQSGLSQANIANTQQSSLARLATEAQLQSQFNAGQQAAGQQYAGGRANVFGSLPGVYSNLAMLPYQQAGAFGSIASNLLPTLDYQRSLNEQDLLRRQGLFTTGLTGIPYTPSGQTRQSTSSQPLFNWFGQG